MTHNTCLLNVKISLSPLPPSSSNSDNEVKRELSWGPKGSRECHSGITGPSLSTLLRQSWSTMPNSYIKAVYNAGSIFLIRKLGFTLPVKNVYDIDLNLRGQLAF